MPTLFLLRHAKTEAAHSGGDKARELTDRGRADARAVGAQLRRRGIDLVLCSSAVRTRQTVQELGLDARVETMDALYNCDVETMLQRIGETEDSVSHLLVVGHSPTIPAAAAELVWAAQPREADQLACSFPTAAWAEITFEGTWRDLERARLAAVHRPRDV
ncbi:SixA phosphatase family protein [Aestuariimicrobium kwangyangense]|uniref:SixA phosphatase family protein n=1 Tax=Aestuariimicrobium kwangyangense TaxID=396389 RepID=UPI0003B61941|nr:histidine phosphatase family protein [Aestuariimicrobium kwangyangense]